MAQLSSFSEDHLAAGKPSLMLSRGASRAKRVMAVLGHAVLLTIAASSAIAVLFIFIFIAKDAIPFFQLRGFKEFFLGMDWNPVGAVPSFGSFTIFVGTGLVTIGAIFVAVPLGVSAAVCLSDILPFRMRQIFKPIIELLAAIPSVAYGFFALIIFAPLLQEHGGRVLSAAWWCIAGPPLAIGTFVISDLSAARFGDPRSENRARIVLMTVLGFVALAILVLVGWRFSTVQISSGTNALNVSIVLGIMALPTVISVSEDALQAVGRDLREGAYALGSTRAETLSRVVLPAAASGLCAAVILGVMRAIGETMVVWMASGNAAQVPSPIWNLLEPVRTLTATIAGDMGEADQSTGSARYHVLFAMALALLSIAFLCNLVSERVIARSVKRQRGG